MTGSTRPGGRTERTRREVLDACDTITADDGYGGLSVDAIAERSGVHKTTIYRRWGSVDAILFDAMVSRAESAIPLTQTGDARLDLVSMARSVAENLQDPVAMAVAGAVLSRSDDGRLQHLLDRFWRERISAASELVVAGQQRGQIGQGLAASTVVERIVGPVWFRVMVLRSPVDDEFVEAIVDSAIR